MVCHPRKRLFLETSGRRRLSGAVNTTEMILPSPAMKNSRWQVRAAGGPVRTAPAGVASFHRSADKFDLPSCKLVADGLF
jgi:hypothetical protein